MKPAFIWLGFRGPDCNVIAEQGGGPDARPSWAGSGPRAGGCPPLLYLEINDLITIDQSAYRQQHNTHTALHRVINDWLCNMSDGNLTAVCSFDITKCFDTINHSIHLRKMEYYGLQSENIKWFKTYLNERAQMVSCHNTVSGKSTISIGVPQGSVLGPLLFLIYVNDINRHVHLGACNLYADDTLVYCNGSTMSELKHNIQQCVSDIHEWYDENKLVINKSKYSVMLATTRQRILQIDNNDLHVHIGDYKLVQSDCIDYLGLKIDETVSWNMQTDNICTQLVFIISRFSRLKHILPSHMLMLIYSSIIQPIFDYAITIWGYTCDNNLHKIQRLQNRAARIVGRRRRRRKFYLKSNKIVNIRLANSLFHRLHTQYVQPNIQYLQQNIQMKRKYHVCKISS